MDATWTLAVSCFEIVYTHMNPNSGIPYTVFWINVADSVCWYSRGFNVVGVDVMYLLLLSPRIIQSLGVVSAPGVEVALC